MTDAESAVPSGEAAEQALALLSELSPDLRGAAIIDRDGSVLAASGEPQSWGDDAAELLSVADAAGEGPVEQIHIGTEEGEVFALRHAGLAAVAVTERFALASLMLFDMRSLLRDLALASPRSDSPGLRPGENGQRDRGEG